MANPYFKFKQFTIYQDQCAMKVCTDACILGAWFSQKIPSYSSILDIGSGSGLLMMMLAQNSKAEIHGIEIDLPSFKQQKENFIHSKWKDKLKAFPGDAKTFAFPMKYDFIISNPPFFENDLQSEIEELNVAKHSKFLTFEELIKIVNENLEPDGNFGVLLPYQRLAYFEDLALRSGFYVTEALLVKQSYQHDFFRGILQLSRQKISPVLKHEITIKNEDGKYSDEFVELLKDYYLYLEPAE